MLAGRLKIFASHKNQDACELLCAVRRRMCRAPTVITPLEYIRENHTQKIEESVNPCWFQAATFQETHSNEFKKADTVLKKSQEDIQFQEFKNSLKQYGIKRFKS